MPTGRLPCVTIGATCSDLGSARRTRHLRSLRRFRVNQRRQDAFFGPCGVRHIGRRCAYHLAPPLVAQVLGVPRRRQHGQGLEGLVFAPLERRCVQEVSRCSLSVGAKLWTTISGGSSREARSLVPPCFGLLRCSSVAPAQMSSVTARHLVPSLRRVPPSGNEPFAHRLCITAVKRWDVSADVATCEWDTTMRGQSARSRCLEAQAGA